MHRTAALILLLATAATAQTLVAPPTDDARPVLKPAVAKLVQQIRVKIAAKPETPTKVTQLAMAYVAPDGNDEYYHGGKPCIDPAEAIGLKPAVAESRRLKPCPKCLPGFVCRDVLEPMEDFPKWDQRSDFAMKAKIAYDDRPVMRTQAMTIIPVANSLPQEPAAPVVVQQGK